jgi:hypothetical protein
MKFTKHDAAEVKRRLPTTYTPDGIIEAAGKLAAIECALAGGNRHDGWVYREGGRLQQCKPTAESPLRGWNAAWDLIEIVAEGK